MSKEIQTEDDLAKSILGSMVANMDMGGDEPSPESSSVLEPVTPSLDYQGGDDAADAPVAKTQGEHDYEKRFKDTQKAFQEEHQKRLDTEKRFAELEAKVATYANQSAAGNTTTKQDAAVEDVLAEFNEKFEDDPKEAIAAAMKKLNRMVTDLSGDARRQATEAAMIASRQREIETAEVAIRKERPDYDTFVDPAFVSRLQSSPQLHKQWMDSGGTPEAAYNLAQRTKAADHLNATGTLPDWYQANGGKRSATTSPAPRRTLAGVSSAEGPAYRAGNTNQVFDSPDEAFAAAFGGR